jgi:hypothetical protein
MKITSKNNKIIIKQKYIWPHPILCEGWCGGNLGLNGKILLKVEIINDLNESIGRHKNFVISIMLINMT